MAEIIYRGIDVSRYQGAIDFDKVKNEGGQDFVIIQAGGYSGGYYTSPTFETYYAGALPSGIYIGYYFYAGSNFTSTEQGESDAAYFANLIDGKKCDFPVFVDVEETSPDDKEGATAAAIAFCEYMQVLGYSAGIYGSDISTFQERLNYDSLLDHNFEFWVAKYGSTPPSYVRNYGIWQYSGTGTVAGVENKVDLNYCYRKYIDDPEPPESELTWCVSKSDIGWAGWNKEFDKSKVSAKVVQNADNIIKMLSNDESISEVLGHYYIPKWSPSAIAGLLAVIDIRSGFNPWRWYAQEEIPYDYYYDKLNPSRYGLLGFDPAGENYVELADDVYGYGAALNHIRVYTWTETVTTTDPTTGLPVEEEITHTETEIVFLGKESDGTAQTAWIGEGTRWIRYGGIKFTNFIKLNNDPAKMADLILKHLVHADMTKGLVAKIHKAAYFWYWYITGRKWSGFPLYFMIKYF